MPSFSGSVAGEAYPVRGSRFVVAHLGGGISGLPGSRWQDHGRQQRQQWWAILSHPGRRASDSGADRPLFRRAASPIGELRR